MAPKRLSTGENLFDFFHAQVDTACDVTGTEMSQEGVYYLAQLLADRGRVPAANRPDTLVELHIEDLKDEHDGELPHDLAVQTRCLKLESLCTSPAEELQQLCGTLGNKLSLAEAEEMIADIDVDGNGLVDFNEFLSMMLDIRGSK